MESIVLTVDEPLRNALRSLARDTDGTAEEIARKAILDAAAADNLAAVEFEGDMAKHAETVN